jgi:UDP-N-acetylmuramoyl-L-alanyl-D-glutamate--2,6-diaminopimelate ligase
MRLNQLLDGVDVRDSRGDLTAVDVTDITLDSSAAAPGVLFCALRGTHRDGHEFAPDAVARGAVAVLGERVVEVDVAQVVVDEGRPALARVAAALHDHPSQKLTVVGVTGTNGKTTTTYLLKAIFDAAGQPCGVIGSLTSERTTPEAPELQRTLGAFWGQGYRATAMEVSSAALVAHRVDAMHFAAAVFTNLGRDHVGEVHPTIDDYFAAKARLFAPDLSAHAVVNADDEWGRRLIGAASIPVTPFSLTDATDVRASGRGSRFVWRGAEVELPIPGRFNVMNAIAAATTAAALGVDIDAIRLGLRNVGTVPGHFEWIDAGQPFEVAVDYAHTPESLEQAMLAARERADEAQVIVVFGCGGDRDPGKRAPMGRAATLADVVIITSDNPRHEDPRAIIDAVAAGVGDHGDVVIEPDRDAAIGIAIARARAGDVVVIAGKGHETGQQIGDTVTPFDDRDVARKHLTVGAA